MKKEILVKKILSILCAVLLVGTVIFRGISPMFTLSAYATGVGSESQTASNTESLPVSAESQPSSATNQADSQSAVSSSVSAVASEAVAAPDLQGTASQPDQASETATGKILVVCSLEDAWSGQPIAVTPTLYSLEGEEAAYDDLTLETELLEIKVDGYKAAKAALSIAEADGVKTVTVAGKISLVPDVAISIAEPVIGNCTPNSTGQDGKASYAITVEGGPAESSYTYALKLGAETKNISLAGGSKTRVEFTGLAAGALPKLVVSCGDVELNALASERVIWEVEVENTDTLVDAWDGLDVVFDAAGLAVLDATGKEIIDYSQLVSGQSYSVQLAENYLPAEDVPVSIVGGVVSISVPLNLKLVPAHNITWGTAKVAWRSPININDGKISFSGVAVEASNGKGYSSYQYALENITDPTSPKMGERQGTTSFSGLADGDYRLVIFAGETLVDKCEFSVYMVSDKLQYVRSYYPTVSLYQTNAEESFFVTEFLEVNDSRGNAVKGVWKLTSENEDVVVEETAAGSGEYRVSLRNGASSNIQVAIIGEFIPERYSSDNCDYPAFNDGGKQDKQALVFVDVALGAPAVTVTNSTSEEVSSTEPQYLNTDTARTYSFEIAAQQVSGSKSPVLISKEDINILLYQDGNADGMVLPLENLTTLDNGESYSGKITLPAGLENGKYQLKITAIDSIAKNSSVGSDSYNAHKADYNATFVIDEIPPKITVDYSGETPGGSLPDMVGERYYFKGETVLTIVIMDENCSDAPDAVEIKLQHNGAAVSPAWEIADIAGGKTYSTVLMNDGVYQIAGISAKDLAGNTGYAEQADTQKIVVVDTEKPKLSIEGVQSNRFYAENKTITLTLRDINLSEEELNRAGSPYSNVIVSDAEAAGYAEGEWEFAGGTFTKTIVFEKDGFYSVSALVTDFAGNSSETVGIDNFTVDKTSPKLTVEYSSSSKAWNNNYFNATRSLLFTVVEHNFDPETKIELKKILPNGESAIIEIDEWTSSGDTHTASYSANEDALYELVNLKITDKAGNSNGVNGDEVTYEGAQAEENRMEFYVDKTTPAGAITAVKTKTVWDKLASILTFGLVDNTSIELELRGTDTSSGHPFTGIDRIEYIKTAQPIDALESDLQALLESRTDWTTRKFNNQTGESQNAAFTITHAEDEGFFYYMRVYDLAENVYYLNSKGMIVDTTAVLESVVPVVAVGAQPINGIYNGDVGVDIKVTDPEKGGICSGIARVEYQVLNLGVETQKAELFNFDTKNYPSVTAEQIKQNQKFETRITLDAAKNNSNDVQVRVTAYDRAGNMTFSDVRVKIDTTAPTIAVRYDNNDVKNGRYFNVPRTATITINERNFDPDNTVIDTNGTVGAWQETSAGSGNQDDRAYSANVTFSSSADYTLAVKTTDLAGNKGGVANFGGSAAPESFTVDLVKPVITVSYDNNDVRNERYYNRSRTANVHIQEHNFSSDGAQVSVAASLNGVPVAAPAISGWSHSGDGNTTTIHYQADADYTFDISYTDLAGNTADSVATQNFTIDTTPPVVDISGVDMKAAYSGNVMPVVRFEDLNLDAEKSTVEFEGVKNGEITYGGSNADTAQTRTFTSDNFPEDPKVDDVYTLSSRVVDKAGNEVSESLMFSVNRFGSTYILHQSTASEIENSHIQAAPQVIITEVNVNRLVTQQASYTHNGNTVMLEAGENYVFSETGDDASWKEYVYTIDAANFEAEGMYSITLLSTDEAENVSSNRATKVKGSELLVDFVVDKTPPSVVLMGVEKGGRYNDTFRTVSIDSEDNLAMAAVEVYLNGQKTPAASYTAQQIQEAGGVLQYKWSGRNERQSLRVVATDRAGNQYEVGVDNVLISGDWFVQYINNIPLLVGSIGSVLLLLILVVFVKRKKSASAKEED